MKVKTYFILFSEIMRKNTPFYSPAKRAELLMKIFHTIASGGTFRAAVDELSLPITTPHQWIMDARRSENPETMWMWDCYCMARAMQIESLTEEMMRIARNEHISTKKKIYPDGGVETTEFDNVQHRALQIKAIQFRISLTAAKMSNTLMLEDNSTKTIENEITQIERRVVKNNGVVIEVVS